jgi:hypothetical protein
MAASNQSTYLAVRVRPRSSRSGVAAEPDGSLVVSVHAPAAEGAANRELVELLARALGAPKSAVQIVRGEKGRHKRVAIAGLAPAEALARLASRPR